MLSEPAGDQVNKSVLVGGLYMLGHSGSGSQVKTMGLEGSRAPDGTLLRWVWSHRCGRSGLRPGSGGTYLALIPIKVRWVHSGFVKLRSSHAEPQSKQRLHWA